MDLRKRYFNADKYFFSNEYQLKIAINFSHRTNGIEKTISEVFVYVPHFYLVE